MSVISRRLVFPNALEADCLPDGAYAAPQHTGVVETHLGAIPGPPGYKLRDIRITTTGGFKMAGVAEGLTAADTHQAVWEWIDGTWFDRGVGHGTSPCIYDLAGTLHIARDEGPGTPSQGYRYVTPDGRIVRGDETFADPARHLWEFTPVGDLTIGQGGPGVHAVDAGGVHYPIEPGDTTVVRAARDGDQLAVATRKLAENETVLLWLTVAEALARPMISPPPPDISPVVIPVDPPLPPKLPKEPPVPSFPFDFNPQARLEALRRTFPTPLGARHAEFLVKSCQLVGNGAGLLQKNGGTHITLPNGINVAQDWMVFQNGTGTDFLGDGEGAATVSWGEAQPNGGPWVDVRGLFVGEEPPVPTPTPTPTDPTLAGRVASLEALTLDLRTRLGLAQDANQRQDEALQALGQRITDLPPSGTATDPTLARKGDRVTVKAEINLGFRKVEAVAHGTIDGGAGT